MQSNGEIQKIPFFAQTTVNISGGTESDTSFSINSLMKLGELAKDDEGDLKIFAFSQAGLLLQQMQMVQLLTLA